MKLVILQIKDIENCEYSFQEYDPEVFNLMRDYEVAWCGDFPVNSNNYKEIAEEVFEYFQRVDQASVDRLNKIGFTGRSISVSDVISLDGHEFYCDCFGWTQIK